MYLTLCLILLWLPSTLTKGYVADLTWYQGCFLNSTVLVNASLWSESYHDINMTKVFNKNIVGCAKLCNRQGYLYFSTSDQEPCDCFNSSLQSWEKKEDFYCSLDVDRKNANKQLYLPTSYIQGFKAVYLSEGPYIDHVNLDFDQTWIVVNMAVVLEVSVEISRLLNISSDSQAIQPVKVSIGQEQRWHDYFIQDVSVKCHNNTVDRVFTVVPEKESVIVRIPIVFTSVGEHYIEVYVTNELSRLKSEIIVTVHHPVPKDLQVVFNIADVYKPSCISQYMDTLENGTYFTFFVNTEFKIEATVAYGENLTFTYTTHNEDGLVNQTSGRSCDLTCEDMEVDDGLACRNFKSIMMLTSEGTYAMTVQVENQYGSLTKTVYLVAIEDRLAIMSFKHDADSWLFLPGEPVNFLVTMEIRSRLNTSLEVEFYRDHFHHATLEDSNSTSLSINCKDEEMSIVSSYGMGCVLAVEFDHSFDREGVYKPVIFVTGNTGVKVHAMLLSNVTVMNHLQGAHLLSDKFVPVNHMTNISLLLNVSSINLTVSWAVVNSFGVIIEKVSTDDPYLSYKFTEIGHYHIECKASNMMGSVIAKTLIEVEEVIGELKVSCDQGSVLLVGQSVKCIAFTLNGTNIEYSWKISTLSYEVFTSENQTLANIKFEEAGRYNVTVVAHNLVSYVGTSFEISVHSPITYVMILQKEPNIHGKYTELKIITSDSTDVQLEFDFGEGRQHYNYSYEMSKDAFYLEYLFERAGNHKVTVYAFNAVSEVSSVVMAVVQHKVDQLEIVLYRAPALMVPAVFIVKTEGHILRRKDLVFRWDFSDGTQMISASPVITKRFVDVGNYSISFTAKNLVSEYKRHLQVEVALKTSMIPFLLHDTIVMTKQQVQFSLMNGNSQLQILSIDMDDVQTAEETLQKARLDFRWEYMYERPGLYRISVTLAGETVLESIILVEEPVTGVTISGPSVVAKKGLSLHQDWTTSTETGTDLVYMWDLGGDILYTTHNKFTKGFSEPGVYLLQVTVMNDISRTVTELEVVVQYPIVHLRLYADPVILGHNTEINLCVTGSSRFLINISYGDGTNQTLYSDDMVVNDRDISKQGIPKYQKIISHRYENIGSYQVSVNVSNSVSYKMNTTVSVIHEPIAGVDVMTDSPAIISLGDKVNVTATVASGQNLQFEWQFTDSYYRKPTVVSSGNTSTATHEFEVAGDYEVIVKVKNHLYKDPVVARLPFKFQAVDEISDLTVSQLNGKTKVVLMESHSYQRTEAVFFRAMCQRGSHVTFVFVFGDGHSATVEGKENFMYIMSGEASHQYTTEGVFQVYVTAVNPLGNVTAYLKEPFSVERPPHIPKLRSAYHILYGENYTFHVDQHSNILYDWRFGDETEVVNSNGTKMTHYYQDAGIYDLLVVAKDRGTKTNTTAKVYVEHKIQGVTLNVSSTLIDTSEEVQLKAVVFPGYDNLVNYYSWKLGNYGSIITKEHVLYRKFTDGKFTVTVSAHNNVSQATSPPVVLYCLSKIEALDMVIKGKPIINNILLFKATYYRGSDISFLWDFKDGSPAVQTNDSSQYIQHNFTQEGIYNIMLSTSNLISEANITRRLFILDRDCSAPDISIHDSSYIKVNRSQLIHYEVKVSYSTCEDTEMVMEYQWNLYHSSNGHPVALTSVDKDLLQQKRLLLRPYSLDVGLYKLEVKVQIKNTFVYNIESIEIEVIPSALDVIIKGGVVRQISRQEDVILDGSLSRDPDASFNSKLRYNWNCSTSFASDDICFKDNLAENITFDQALVIFPADFILPSLEEIIITLSVSTAEKKSQNAVQVIRIKRKPEFFKLSIYCPQCEKQIVNANEHLRLHAVCPECPAGETQFDWTTHFVFKSVKFRPAKADIPCTIKRIDGSNFKSLMYPVDSDLNKMYALKSVVTKGNNSVIHSSLLSDPGRMKRQTSYNNSTFWGFPVITESTSSFGRRQRTKSSRGSGRRTHYSLGNPFPNFEGMFLDNGLFEVEEGTPKEGDSSQSRVSTSSRVKPGVNTNRNDKIYNENVRPVSQREKHILEKPSSIFFFDDEQTTTGNNKQSLVFKPYFFKEGFEYTIKVQTRLKDNTVRGTAMTTFTVNSSPAKGVCELSPNSGIELITQFRLYCYEWKDEDKPLQYEVSFSYQDGADVRYIVYRGLRQDVNFTLPAGQAQDRYKLMMYISVLDDRLAKTSVCRYQLEVQPYSLESRQQLEQFVFNHTDFNNPNSRLSQAKGLGDNDQVKGVIHSLGRCLQRLLLHTEYDRNLVRTSVDRMLHELQHLPMREELEILQTVEAMESLAELSDEFDLSALETSVSIITDIDRKLIYISALVIDEDLFLLLHRITSSLIKSLAQHQQHHVGIQKILYRDYLEKMIQIHNSFLKKEMTYHTIEEGEQIKISSFITTKAARYRLHENPTLQISNTKFVLPEKMEPIFSRGHFDRYNDDMFMPSQKCFQVHLTKFNFNPYSFKGNDAYKIQSEVCSLDVLTCNGTHIEVSNLNEDNLVQIEVPRVHLKDEIIENYQIKKSVMNIHGFNVTQSAQNNSLNIEIEATPVTEGNMFPIAVLISFNVPPSPDQYLIRQEIQDNHLQIFLPSGFLNHTGEYFIGLVDAGLNKGRPRRGEVDFRNYTLKLWWNKCLFWNETSQLWSEKGCWATKRSTYDKTHCLCNHLTAFGGHFELIPNDLSHISVADFFDLNENPVTFCLTGVILLLYILLMILCHQVDKHDAKKGGITYLTDNSLTDRQKYEVTIETGFRKGAGTTSKISVILHGVEGMSETRELISDEDSPLFERNSRDKFILTLPESIGKIWKVQLWHNNFGASPSWYLSKVIVKDLNTGNTYYFISEKWMAVEEDDGKVEREFMALEGNLGFRKVFWTKGVQYLSDYHLWMSLFTRPSYSQFNRKQRLTCCLTLLMMYMCLNAMWYKEVKPEYRGEFGLLDVSLRSITVGAICCAIVIPVKLLIVFLFRKSKTWLTGNQFEPIIDEEKEDEQFASGKPDENVPEEEELESVQPIMTYSILDQSILNWPSIQDWAQKQWVKRRQGYQETSNSPEIPHLPNQFIHQRILGLEIDQASSGFEDSNSTDPRKQVTISSQNSSQKIKAPSVNSTISHKSSSEYPTRKTTGSRLFLPHWCQYIAWLLCAVIIGTCAVTTIIYGFRFGKTKSIQWLQSLYFSFVICVFITQPIIIIIVVIYTAIRYRNDLSILNHEDGDFGEKAKLEILRRKKEQIQYTEQEELERGVAARQRSRYLRFARPPQEKQLIEARKKIMKEKKAMSLIRDLLTVSVMFIMLCIMAYGKDIRSPFHVNDALKNLLTRSGMLKNHSIRFETEWYKWSQTILIDALYPQNNSHYDTKLFQPLDNSFIIGQVQIRQFMVKEESCLCPYDLPFLPGNCFHDYHSSNKKTDNVDGFTEYQDATSSFSIFGKHGIYDNSGYILKLNKTRPEVLHQLEELERIGWLGNQTRGVVTEFTVYNPPTNLFTSVIVLLELPSSGGAYLSQTIRSSYIYRYVTQVDNLILAVELMFIIFTAYKIGVQLCEAVQANKYFHNFWMVIDMIFSGLSLVYIVFYLYRFLLVSETVESLRSSYFEEFVDISFLTFWDEMIQDLIGMLMFLAVMKFLKLLLYGKVFFLFGTVYKRLQKEFLVCMVVFVCSVLVFSRIGSVLFGAVCVRFSDIISSILTVSALMVRIQEDCPDSSILHTIRIFILFVTVFATGLLTSYMVAVLSYRLRVQKHRHSVFLTMKPREIILFYWRTFLLMTGIHTVPLNEEPENVLPPEFTMAEVEYQVDELFFRINTLTGSHGLPEKPASYLTDSDGTYGLGDDGISSGGSEVNIEDDDRLETRVHKIEDSLCSHEPYLAQLLKLNQTDIMTKGKEKQIRSHLEMEIFRQLQNQRNNTIGDKSAATSGSSSEMTTPFGDRKSTETSVKKYTSGTSSLQQHTFVHCAEMSPQNDKTLLTHARTSTASSSSNSESQDDIVKNIDRVHLLKEKSCKKIGPKLEDDQKSSKIVKKPEPPHKPTFHSSILRDVQDTNKTSVLTSPTLRHLRTSHQAIERSSLKGESGSGGTTESSSGSEQDAIHGKPCVQSQLKRNLRKTKSRGKGKGCVNLNSVLLDDLDTSDEVGTSFKISETEPILEQEPIEDYVD